MYAWENGEWKINPHHIPVSCLRLSWGPGMPAWVFSPIM